MPSHAEKRHLQFSASQMFNLVSDIEKYPEFLPWCMGLRIKNRNADLIVADMVIGYKMFREQFTSKVKLTAPDRIDVMYEDGPFKYLNNKWVFIDKEDGSCIIDFYVDFEFNSKFMEKMVGSIFGEAVKVMVNAFERRAKIIYPNSFLNSVNKH